MTQVGSLTINIGANTASFESSLRDTVRGLDDIKRHAESMKVNFEPTRGIYEQMATKASLDEQYFRATHSNLQNMLRDNENTFAGLKDRWKENQEMMTLITNTEAAKKNK